MEEYRELAKFVGFKGINTDVIPIILPPKDESIYVVGGNNILIKNGKIEKLKGSDYLNSITTQQGIADYRTVLGMPIYRKYDGTKKLMLVTPRKLYYLKDDDTWFELGDITNGGNDDTLTYANIDNKFVFTLSSSTFIYYWDGSTFGKLFTAPQDDNLRARFLGEFKTQLFLFRTIEETVEKHQRVYPSNAGNITTYSAEDLLDLESEGVILNAKQLEDSFIAYFKKAIYTIFWVDTSTGYAHKSLMEGQGLLAADTLCGNKDVHFFLSQEGLMKLLRGDVPRSVSNHKFNKLILDEIDPVYYYRATQFFYPHLNLLYLSYPSSGNSYNNIQIIYDHSVNELVSKKDLSSVNYSAYGVFEKDLSGLTPDERKDYGLSFIPIFGDKDGYVREQKINQYQDETYNYESNIVLAPTFLKHKTRNKRILQVDLLVEKLTDENITFGLDIANEMNESFDYSYTLNGNGNKGVRRYSMHETNDIDVFGQEFTIKLKDVNNSYGWRLHSIFLRGYYSGVK